MRKVSRAAVSLGDGCDGDETDAVSAFVGGEVAVSFFRSFPHDENDRIDLRKTVYEENNTSSSLAFCYILDDVITVIE